MRTRKVPPSSAVFVSIPVGARISKKRKEGARNREVSVRLSIFLAKQVHYCLVDGVSKFRSRTRNI